MKRLFAVLFAVLVLCGAAAAQANIQVDGVEFVGFGADGEVKLKKSKLDVCQVVRLKNNSGSAKRVAVFLKITSFAQPNLVVTELPPGKETDVKFLELPPTPGLRPEYVTVTSY
ncbi:MAG: hypothetical protein K2H09_01810 [Treponemataceae bacterium]|nr:hypothetical protein [Treponemataceae bacterium]